MIFVDLFDLCDQLWIGFALQPVAIGMSEVLNKLSPSLQSHAEVVRGLCVAFVATPCGCLHMVVMVVRLRGKGYKSRAMFVRYACKVPFMRLFLL